MAALGAEKVGNWMRKALICLVVSMLTALGAVAQDNPAGLAVGAALEAIETGDWEKADTVVAPAGQVGHDIVTWHRLRAGVGEFSEYTGFLARRADWPGLPLLKKQGEAKIPTGLDATSVISYFGDQPPETGGGALALAGALIFAGDIKQGEAVIVTAWRNLWLSKSDHDAFIASYGPVLVNHHRARQDMLLWRGLTTQAGRLNALVGSDYKALALARIALIEKKNGVDALIKAVPETLMDHPGLAHARFEWRASHRQSAGAINLLLKHSTSTKALGKPDAWGNRRRVLAREKMRAGKGEVAYQIAANHYLSEGDNFIDLEWLAGYIALRHLKDPQKALMHFQRFRAGVDTPISLGRAGYWEGRAYEALKQPEEARAAYAFGGEYQTSFYGQLAGEKAGLAMDPALTGREVYPDIKTTPYGNSSVLQAAVLFQMAGDTRLFTRFMRHLAEVMSPRERGALAQLALDLKQPYTALFLAKYAARSGTVLARPYFPMTDLVTSKMPVPAELALSIIRRESEFNADVISRAGARGLMQLMPKTARAMAKQQGLPYDLARLNTDPTYNATLGSAYLAVLIEEFGPYYPFVAAGYNAGPSRPKKWQALYGDPRQSTEAAVDWIEHIPFRETRNYVMRVTESLAVYRARLSGKTSKLRLSRDLTGR